MKNNNLLYKEKDDFLKLFAFSNVPEIPEIKEKPLTRSEENYLCNIIYCNSFKYFYYLKTSL